MEELRFQITDEMEDERIDKCMSLLVENLSRSFIQKLIKDGNVLVNGTPVKGSCRVKCDDEVVFSVPESVEPDIEPENIPLDILYEDAGPRIDNQYFFCVIVDRKITVCLYRTNYILFYFQWCHIFPFPV